MGRPEGLPAKTVDRLPLTKRVPAGTLDAVPLWGPGRPVPPGVRVLPATAAAAFDPDRREVVDAHGGRHGFDHLVRRAAP